MKKSDKNKVILEYLTSVCKIRPVWVCHDPKFIWPCCPRVASRSMREWFFSNGLIIDHHKTFEFLEALDPGKLSEYLIWTFVRNPFDRVVSIKHMVGNAGKDWLDWISGLGERVARSVLLDPPPNYNQELNEKWFDELHHLPCSLSTHIDGEVFVDFIGRYENLESDWKKLLTLLQLEPGSLNSVGASVRGPANDYYNDLPAMAAVSIAYADDIKLLYNLIGG